MNNEQKLLKLLQVAVENGWEDPLYQLHLMKDGFEIFSNLLLIKYDAQELCFLVSINDLVTNWEKGEVSFIEALCRANQDAVSEFYDFALGYEGYCSPYLIASLNITLMWNFDCETRKLRPASKRLDWLFETFKHLLD